MIMGLRVQYSKEYKKQAVELVLKNGRRISQTARELGISHYTLKDWVKRHDWAEEETPVPLTGLTPKEECRLLRKRVAYLEEELDVTKKLQAFLARQPKRNIVS
jgi:transposase